MSITSEEFIQSLADSIDFDFLGEEMGFDLKEGLISSLREGAIFPSGDNPLAILRQAMMTAVRRIIEDSRWDLFHRFLLFGPQDFEDSKPNIERLSQAETASVISFLWNHVINSFQGAITELFAAAPCTRILQQLIKTNRFRQETRLFMGDSILAPQIRGSRYAKGADIHMLAVYPAKKLVNVMGVGEVKSYFCREDVLQRQLSAHIARLHRGIRIFKNEYAPEGIEFIHASGQKVIRVTVLPDNWILPRNLRWRLEGSVRIPETDPGLPTHSSDDISQTGENEWRVTLRWSREALASVSYEMTYWLMSKIGELLYKNGVPKEWAEMTLAEAGYNAAKEKLYYAIRPYAVKLADSDIPGNPKLTRKESLEMQRAVALYNTYCFGYVIGMNFRNKSGRREMLWPEDLDEIIAKGETKNHCKIRGY